MKIQIDHIAKIEGHAGFVADLVGGDVIKARLNVLEGARLLEGILRGRSFEEVSSITARICGVCPVVHTLTSLKAIESAMKIYPSKQTILLRRLMMDGQLLNSHALHLFFFSLSDFFGEKDDLRLIGKYPERAKDALLIREFGNKIIEAIGGRSIHPLTPQVGGFKKMPSEEAFKNLAGQIKKVLAATEKMAVFFSHLKYPDFERRCNFVGLNLPGQYAICEGIIRVNGEKSMRIADFMPQIIEARIPGDAVKRSKWRSEPYMVGALARLNFNAEKLKPRAKKMFSRVKLNLPTQNPFYNILAQAIEMIHCAEEAEELIGEILENGIEEERPSFKIQAGKGFAAMEAPRGTLFYCYDINDEGMIEDANIITPTSQNLGRLEADLKEYLPKLEMKSRKEKEEKIKMLVRAYDPCLTCATH
ncbi:MAG: Ni/Fe hydrogenase subunit alpha [Candidatus Portnoybacteria bacterium]|nr:Ni/Fe hydrogenase subunit alpha [Candidatus Portnoybacteria bacterium]